MKRDAGRGTRDAERDSAGRQIGRSANRRAHLRCAEIFKPIFLFGVFRGGHLRCADLFFTLIFSFRLLSEGASPNEPNFSSSAALESSPPINKFFVFVGFIDG
ncbi:MAG: hypothetical protein ACK4I8_08705 [Armatimonadota bacterium]